MSRNDFIQTFGNKNPNKCDRCSWSGRCVPKYGLWNDCGQRLIIDKHNNIMALYSYKRDKRSNMDKSSIPQWINTHNKLVIALWPKDKMYRHVNNKFNQSGFFICYKDPKGRYDKIRFGLPFTFKKFVENIKKGTIILDSGMYSGNTRNYSHWRGNKSFWNGLIISTNLKSTTVRENNIVSYLS